MAERMAYSTAPSTAQSTVKTAPITFAVLACYKPDLAGLEPVLAQISGQVAGVILVDNGSLDGAVVALRNRPGVTLIAQDHNSGLADAQNCGIRAALDLGATQILLLDQDSRPAPDMLPALQAALDALRAQGKAIAAVAPQYDEPHRRARSSAQTKGAAQPQKIGAVIASGALIPARAFADVGLFEATLFIDLVDTEWCFRAGAAGLDCYVVPAARMQHRIGDQVLRLGGRDRSVHAPFRSYYQIRNLLLIARLPHVSWGWSLRQLAVMLPRALVIAALVPPRAPRAALPLLGLWHGVLGRSGRLKD